MKTFKHFFNGLVLVAVLASNAMAVTIEELRVMVNAGKLGKGDRALLQEDGLRNIANMFANNGNPKRGLAEAAIEALGAEIARREALAAEADNSADHADIDAGRTTDGSILTPMLPVAPPAAPVLNNEEELGDDLDVLLAGDNDAMDLLTGLEVQVEELAEDAARQEQEGLFDDSSSRTEEIDQEEIDRQEEEYRQEQIRLAQEAEARKARFNQNMENFLRGIKEDSDSDSDLGYGSEDNIDRNDIVSDDTLNEWRLLLANRQAAARTIQNALELYLVKKEIARRIAEKLELENSIGKKVKKYVAIAGKTVLAKAVPVVRTGIDYLPTAATALMAARAGWVISVRSSANSSWIVMGAVTLAASLSVGVTYAATRYVARPVGHAAVNGTENLVNRFANDDSKALGKRSRNDEQHKTPAAKKPKANGPEEKNKKATGKRSRNDEQHKTPAAKQQKPNEDDNDSSNDGDNDITEVVISDGEIDSADQRDLD